MWRAVVIALGAVSNLSSHRSRGAPYTKNRRQSGNQSSVLGCSYKNDATFVSAPLKNGSRKWKGFLAVVNENSLSETEWVGTEKDIFIFATWTVGLLRCLWSELCWSSWCACQFLLASSSSPKWHGHFPGKPTALDSVLTCSSKACSKAGIRVRERFDHWGCSQERKASVSFYLNDSEDESQPNNLDSTSRDNE